jgi:hypothetical protein
MPQCQFLFSAVFVFQKSYIGNILRIGQNKSQSSYLPDVVGMTSGVCQGQRSLPAGVPEVSTVSSRKDRLYLKGRLCQQPAGDSTEESQSRMMKIRFLQWLDR